MFSIKLQCNIDDLKSKYLNHYALVLQYFCQWLHYDNLNLHSLYLAENIQNA